MYATYTLQRLLGWCHKTRYRNGLEYIIYIYIYSVSKRIAYKELLRIAVRDVRYTTVVFFTGYTLRHCHTRICAENSTQGPHRGTLHFKSFIDQLGINHYNRALQPGVGTATFCSSPVYRQLRYAAWENTQSLFTSEKKKLDIKLPHHRSVMGITVMNCSDGCYRNDYR